MKYLPNYLITCLFLMSVAAPVSGQIIDKGRYFGIGSAFKTFTITTPGLPVNAGQGINGSVNTGRRVITPFGREVNKVIRLYSEGQTERAIIVAEVLLESAEIKGAANRTEIAASLNLLARLHYQQENNEKAEMYFKRVVNVNKTVQGGNPLEQADGLERLGVFYCGRAFDDKKNEAKWLESARSPLQQALKIKQEKMGANHLEVAQLHIFLGTIYQFRDKRYDLAVPHFKQAWLIKKEQLQQDDLQLAIAAGALADVYRMMDKGSEAEPLFKKVLQIREKKQGLEDPALGGALSGLTALYLQQDKLNEAEPYAVRALAIKTKHLDADNIELAYHQFQLALLYHKQGQYQKAEPLYVKALVIREKKQGDTHPDLAPILHNLSILYHAMGKDDKALSYRKRSDYIKAQL
ncbi:MAG: tetratricopeptide repeat protein [Verrucomicrobiota bacterium]